MTPVLPLLATDRAFRTVLLAAREPHWQSFDVPATLAPDDIAFGRHSSSIAL